MTNILRATCALLSAVVLAGIAACKDASAAEPIVIATASPGGPYLPYGQGLARILTRELGQEVAAQSTQGPAQNILLLEKKQATLAFITMGVGLQAWNGSDWTKGTQYRSMRVIFPMFDTAFQFVAAKRLHLNRDSPDESQTGINVRVFPALLQDRREVLTATTTSGNPNAWSRVDLAVFPGIWAHSFCRVLLYA